MSPYYEQGVSPKGIHRFQPSVRLSGMLAHRVLSVSDAVCQELIDLGLSAAKIETLRCPVDLPRYENVDGSAFRAELGMSRSDVLITAVGHAVPVKGWDVLIRAFGNVASDFPRARLAFVGSTEAPDEHAFTQGIRDLVRKAGLTQRICFAGRRSDIPICLSASDIFVLPSRSEGQPLALMEAMASGLPCIAAAVGGIPETITHGQNGLLFERENVGQLAERLKCVLSDAALRRHLGNSAMQTSKAFGIDSYVHALFALYCNLLKGKGA
jgi:glycosyltransferase involved in cell wall biosynthesis